MSRRQAQALLLGLVAALITAPLAFATPGTVASKQAQAQQVLSQVQALDANLEHAVDAYNLANQKLARIERDLRENQRELHIAQGNLRRAQATLESRLVAIYTSAGENTGLEVLLGSTSIDDLITRIDTVNRVSDQSEEVLRQVKTFRAAVRSRRARLKTARVEQARLVAERASQKASIESQLAQRQQLLSSIRSEIGRLQAAERAQQAELARQARARLSSAQTGAEVLAAGAGAMTGSDPTFTPPPSRYGGVVGIAMQYLGIPYVYAQVGVSLPHNAAAQYGYGSPVSRSQLQPGDLVFFNGLGHDGIYIGGNAFIHSPHTGDVVKISSMTGWYASSYVGARRL